MRSFITKDDANGKATDTITVSDTRYAVSLTANMAKTVDVPVGAKRVLLTATVPVWVQYDAAAAIPTADDLSGSAPEYFPVSRILDGIQSLGLVSPDNGIVNLLFYG